ncbi:hypothetical protein ABPG75_009424 [Micractinium tetrahymenae]
MPPPAMPFDSLPDSLLGRILWLAGASEGASLTLVSRRWRDCFFAEPSLWRTFLLSGGPEAAGAAPLAAQHAVLQRVAGFVQRLEVAFNASEAMSRQGREEQPALSIFLDAIPAGQLQQLHLSVLQLQPGVLQRAVQRFPHLLELELTGATLPAGTPAMLRQLRQLRCLRIQAFQHPEGVAEAAAQCGDLAYLQLRSLLMPLPPLQALSRLTRLRRLILKEEVFEAASLERFASPEVAGASFHACSFELERDGKLTVEGAASCNAFTIHGLWPEYADGSWLQFCDSDFKRCSSCHGCRTPEQTDPASSADHAASGGRLQVAPQRRLPRRLRSAVSEDSASLQWRDEPSQQQRECEWPSFKGSDEHFWVYEYSKHGTCADAIPDRDAFAAVALSLREEYDLDGAFAQAGIEPSDTRTYTAAELERAVRGAYGTTPLLVCSYQSRQRRWLLQEVRLCIGLDLKARDCPEGVLADHACEGHARCGDHVLLPVGTAEVPDECSQFIPSWGPGPEEQPAQAVRLETSDAGGSEHDEE